MTGKPITLRGLTWGHRRAIAPLAATRAPFQAVAPAIEVDWSVRDLRAFEHQPLEDTVGEFDLIVFDHPFVGRIAGSGLFTPVDDVLAAVPGASDPASYAGPSLHSYRWDGRIWGVPVDAATMHAVFRRDLMEQLGQDLPRNWAEVAALGEAARRRGLFLALANGNHHGFLTIGTLMHNMGAGWTAHPEGGLSFSLAAFRKALAELRALTRFAPAEAVTWNSIALHEVMTTRDDLVYCPLTYGYATYGEEDFGRRRLAFADAPGLRAPFPAGALVGGAAIGLSAHSRNQAEAKRYLRFALHPQVQIELFGPNHGQPARIEAWTDPDLNHRFNDYFSAVAETLATAAVRPRFSGYGAFEKSAGDLLVRHFRGVLEESRLVDGLAELVVQSGGEVVAD